MAVLSVVFDQRTLEQRTVLHAAVHPSRVRIGDDIIIGDESFYVTAVKLTGRGQYTIEYRVHKRSTFSHVDAEGRLVEAAVYCISDTLRNEDPDPRRALPEPVHLGWL